MTLFSLLAVYLCAAWSSLQAAGEEHHLAVNAGGTAQAVNSGEKLMRKINPHESVPIHVDEFDAKEPPELLEKEDEEQLAEDAFGSAPCYVSADNVGVPGNTAQCFQGDAGSPWTSNHQYQDSSPGLTGCKSKCNACKPDTCAGFAYQGAIDFTQCTFKTAVPTTATPGTQVYTKKPSGTCR
eukprot:gnl/MRDRNA2_/MRDRNA2_72346_c0_seq1.p1 gnl/MRDRNA2_/MRDRNA2_72346_c0~~gnl/MRDRNA2_/MRDRNA2_72346_c0_seq1.p1  ORF type:complete len:182 (+),score=35.41 gnl/MRDRNA2_/MRDRNA2_72346_c0_seq1:113-658(+)